MQLCLVHLKVVGVREIRSRAKISDLEFSTDYIPIFAEYKGAIYPGKAAYGNYYVKIEGKWYKITNAIL